MMWIRFSIALFKVNSLIVEREANHRAGVLTPLSSTCALNGQY